VAATKKPTKYGSIAAAALALPGVVVHAENAPESGEVALKYLHYNDSQPGLDRITVSSPSIYVLLPISPRWSLEGTAVSDAVSGATPRYHTAISGASRHMRDERHAVDVKVTRYQERASFSLGVSRSDEHDYTSNALSFDVAIASDDNNRTWNLGVGTSSDSIGSTNDTTLHESRKTTEVMVGVTQAVTANDLVQGNVTVSNGSGYYSDPYKEPDVRPNKRDQVIGLLRWNHHFSELGASLRTSYRYYHDTFGISAHTFSTEWVQPITPRLSVTPSLRLYSQSAATFYFDPIYDKNVGAPYPPNYFSNPPTYISPDQRLSAFGAVTGGIKFVLQADANWRADLKVEHYVQQSNWRIGGSGSVGLDNFYANFIQLGLSRRF